MLIAWGKNDQIFPPAGAEPYKRDLKTLEFHLLDAGHFALETNGDEIAEADAGLPRQAREEVTRTSTRSFEMEFNKSDTALVVIDPQNDVLSETGVSWGLVGESIKENNTVENLERLFRAAKERRFRGLHLAPLPLPGRSGLGVRRGGRADDARGQGVLPARPAQPRRVHGLRRRLARPLQAVHRGRQDGRGEPPQGVGAADQRPRPAAPQAPRQARSSWPGCSPISAWRATCAS